MSNQLPEKRKGRKAAVYRGAECLNCGQPLDLSDVYCSYCGQLNTTKSLSLNDFFGEFVGSIITYDSKFRHTLKDLLFRPGTITRNYVDGKRLKYANPFRFFLSVSIIYFLIQGLIITFTGENQFINNKNTGNPTVLDSIENADSPLLNFNPAALDSLGITDSTAANVLAEKYGNPNQKKLDSIIKATVSNTEKDTLPSYEFISEEHLDTLSWANKQIKRFVLYYDFYETTKIKDPAQALDSLHHEQNNFNRWAYQKNRAFEQIKENPTDFLTYLLEKTPFFVFFFTPFYALFFWLIYSKSKYTYMEHMIFIFHIFSFIFLAMLIALIPDTIIGNDIFNGILFVLIGPFYFYKALRNFYKEIRIITIFKFLFLNFVFWISASISALLFFAITAAMY